MTQPPSPEGPPWESDATPRQSVERDRELESLRAERREMGEELLRLYVDHATVTAAAVGLRRENAKLRSELQSLIELHTRMSELLSHSDLSALRALIAPRFIAVEPSAPAVTTQRRPPLLELLKPAPYRKR